jgi:hypothetical protein
MAYKTIDRNLYRKVYPYKRAAPRYAYLYDTIVSGGASVEAAKVTFTDADSASYSITSSYLSVPSVVIATVDSAGNGGTNVSITVSSISTTAVTISSSAKFTGQVHIHIVAV